MVGLLVDWSVVVCEVALREPLGSTPGVRRYRWDGSAKPIRLTSVASRVDHGCLRCYCFHLCLIVGRPVRSHPGPSPPIQSHRALDVQLRPVFRSRFRSLISLLSFAHSHSGAVCGRLILSHAHSTCAMARHSAFLASRPLISADGFVAKLTLLLRLVVSKTRNAILLHIEHI